MLQITITVVTTLLANSCSDWKCMLWSSFFISKTFSYYFIKDDNNISMIKDLIVITTSTATHSNRLKILTRQKLKAM